MVTNRFEKNWDGYRYFLEVARTGTLSLAAARLDTEHTTVARRIKRLETNLATRSSRKATKVTP
jgi:DNA-binding transcriptional LysR family regulator